MALHWIPSIVCPVGEAGSAASGVPLWGGTPSGPGGPVTVPVATSLVAVVGPGPDRFVQVRIVTAAVARIATVMTASRRRRARWIAAVRAADGFRRDGCGAGGCFVPLSCLVLLIG